MLESRIAYTLWKEKAKLKSFLEGLAVRRIMGITMTGLCDAFGSKRRVEYIASVCEEVFEDPLYLTIDGKLAGSKS